MAAVNVSVAVVVIDRSPTHVRVAVFVGPYGGDRGHVGQLTIGVKEYDDLRALLELVDWTTALPVSQPVFEFSEYDLELQQRVRAQMGEPG